MVERTVGEAPKLDTSPKVSVCVRINLTTNELTAAINEGVFVLGLCDGQENLVGSISFLREDKGG